jgi:hypothetical protein
VVKRKHVPIEQLGYEHGELIIAETPKEFDCAETRSEIGVLDECIVTSLRSLHVRLQQEGAPITTTIPTTTTTPAD